MTVTGDILSTYRAPRLTLRRLFARQGGEGYTLGYALLACFLVFVGQWPRLSREAVLSGRDLEVLVGGALLGWLFVMPVALYVLAWISQGILRALGRRCNARLVRFSLVWALLAAAPLWLLNGLTAGLAGPGIGLDIVGLLGLAAFLFFWALGMAEAVERHG